jgi:hypothetical protein
MAVLRYIDRVDVVTHRPTDENEKTKRKQVKTEIEFF